MTNFDIKKQQIISYLKFVRVQCNNFRHTTPIDELTIKTITNLLNEMDLEPNPQDGKATEKV